MSCRRWETLLEVAFLQEDYGYLSFDVWWTRIVPHLVKKSAQRSWERFKSWAKQRGFRFVPTQQHRVGPWEAPRYLLST